MSKISTNPNVRIEPSKTEHLTAMVTTNAAGEVAPTMFIFKSKAETAQMHTNVGAGNWAVANESAYMTAQEFTIWAIKFIDWLKSRPADQHGRHVLIFDGHSSHLLPDVLLTFACAQLAVVCLPSHTTHVLQPNDSGTNKTIKTNEPSKQALCVLGG